MIQLNLVPWREQARQLKKMQFGISLGMAAGLGVVFVILIHLYVFTVIGYQNISNQYLQNDLNQEKASLAILNQKKEQLIQIKTDLNFLFSLSDSSFKAVRLLDTIPRMVPQAVSLNKLDRNEDQVTLIGRAQSDLQVTLLMENLGKSTIFKDPVLTEISTKENMSGEERFFQLKVEQKQ